VGAWLGCGVWLGARLSLAGHDGVELLVEYVEPAFDLGQEWLERCDYCLYQCLLVLGEWPLFLHARRLRS
jgi:hypothetical protein